MRTFVPGTAIVFTGFLRYVTIITRSPGTDYSKWYHMDEGDVCYTNGERVYSRADGYDWVQLEDGGWVAAHLLGI